jgi:hypothetical protein
MIRRAALYLFALKVALKFRLGEHGDTSDHWKNHVSNGIKTSLYTYHDQFKSMIGTLLIYMDVSDSPGIGCSVISIAATNILESSLLLTSTSSTSATLGGLFQHILDTVASARLRGLAGEPLYPLGLGDVYTTKTLLS